ncbi:MAG: Multiple sugar-binding protein precursor [Chloroflexi bacterium ADurb.Bin325]|nr:MAG: Multiple sugar-binding protein precursor [Chloroflexi bacterium ADurb.Bin325]
MHKFSRRKFLGLVAATGGTLLAGCVAAPATQAPSAEAPAEGEPAQKPAATQKVTIEMWAPHPLDENIKINEFLAENFLPDHPDTDFKFTRVPDEWEQKFKTAAAGGTLPDIFAVDGINLPTFASRGLCAELDEAVVPKSVLDDFYPSALAEMQWRGKTYATTIETNSQALRINMDKIEEAGVELPQTWDELISVGQTLTFDQAGVHPNEGGFDWDAVKQWGFETWCCLGEGSTWMILPWIWMNGGDVYEESTKKVTIADAPAVKGIQFLRDLVHTYKIWPRAGVAQAGPEGTFYGQVVIMSGTGAFDLANLTVTNPPEFKWDILKFPRPETGEYISGVGGWLMSANAASKNLAQVMPFMTFTTSDTWQLHASKYGYALTGRKSIAEQRLAEVPQLKVFLEAMATGRARPRSTQYPLITEALQLAFDESIFGDRSPEEALADAKPKIEDALAKEEAE